MIDWLIDLILKIDRKIYLYRKKLLFEDNIKLADRNYSIRVILYNTFPFNKMTQIIIGTQGALPNVYLDSNNKLASMYHEKHPKVKKFQKHSLEGNMDDYFTVYTPEEMKIESLQFLTPDVLHFFKDNYNSFDILLHGGTFDMRKSGTVDVNRIKNNYEYLIKKVNRIYKYWNTQYKIDSLANSLDT